MIAVEHKVDLSQLVDLNRRKSCETVRHRLDLCPALAVGVPFWHETAREIGIASDAANDGVEGDLPQNLSG